MAEPNDFPMNRTLHLQHPVLRGILPKVYPAHIWGYVLQAGCEGFPMSALGSLEPLPGQWRPFYTHCFERKWWTNMPVSMCTGKTHTCIFTWIYIGPTNPGKVEFINNLPFRQLGNLKSSWKGIVIAILPRTVKTHLFLHKLQSSFMKEIQWKTKVWLHHTYLLNMSLTP